jgi:aldehyde dehydrogenase (NAD(P)+)
VNIINGYGKEAGAALVDNPKVHKIAFTGSTATGKEIMKAAARTMKNITLETGGKSPFIVFEDANLAQAVKWAHLGIMSNSGQICTANSRILVHESVSTVFVEQFKEKVAKTSILGDPFDEKTFQGPQVSKEQYDRVLAYIQSGLDEGAELIMGGKPAGAATAGGKGYFIEPTVFGNVLLDSKICQEEIFGPCALIIPFKTEAQAIEIANDSKYGLGAMVFTRDLVRAHRVARDVESGMVWINSSNDSDVRVPFGGVKQSGIGRELGEAGLEPYFNVKAIHVNLTED